MSLIPTEQDIVDVVKTYGGYMGDVCKGLEQIGYKSTAIHIAMQKAEAGEYPKLKVIENAASGRFKTPWKGFYFNY